MSKTMSVRMDRDNYQFLHEITKEEGSDLAKRPSGAIMNAIIRFGANFPAPAQPTRIELVNRTRGPLDVLRTHYAWGGREVWYTALRRHSSTPENMARRVWCAEPRVASIRSAWSRAI
jgi:hypothetical protein